MTAEEHFLFLHLKVQRWPVSMQSPFLLTRKRTGDRSEIRNMEVLSKKVCERDLLIYLISKSAVSSVYKKWKPVICRITRGVH